MSQRKYNIIIKILTYFNAVIQNIDKCSKRYFHNLKYAKMYA